MMRSIYEWSFVPGRMVLALALICAMMLPVATLGGDQLSDLASNDVYGASEERLQHRDSASMIDLAGKWRMAGQDPDMANPFGSGKARTLPKMDGWTWYDVSVPGSVRSGLLEAGAIKDPYWSDNAGKSIWTEKMAWWFSKSFTVPNQWAGRRVMIGFEGVDYYSSIWINGKFLGDHEGMYGGPVFDVTSLVRFGEPNEVVVQIHPGGTDEPGRVFKGYIFMKWHYLTDLSPRGIWRGARLVATGPVRLENPFVRIESANEKEAMLQITADVRNPGKAGKVTIDGTLSAENFRGTNQTFSFAATPPEGDGVVTYRMRVPNPKLWWPMELGRPNLYRLTLKVREDGKVSDSISTVVGIRTLSFEANPGIVPMSTGAGDQRRGGTGGNSAGLTLNNRFMCRINGKLISLRGAGGFGCHDFIYRFHDRKDAWFINAALSMNFNYIRVHGSGLIATDEFYNLCDRMGMLVSQEFMISNMGLSGTHPNVWRTQTVQSILRLRNHPSLFYWCGGNEFNPDNAADETKQTVDMFEESVRKYDGTRLFSRAAQYVNDPHYADQTGLYGGDKIAACSEYSGGYAGNILPERALRKFLPEEDAKRWPPVTKDPLDTCIPPDGLVGWDNTERGKFVFHTALTGRNPAWPGDLMLVLPQWALFGVPHTMDQAYEISQVSGGYATAYTMETFRSRWPTPSLYASWDYAPIWPMSLIWGPVDYYGNVLPCAYYYKRAQEPLHVLMQLDPKEHMKAPILGIDAFPKVFQTGAQVKGRVFVASDLRGSLGEHTATVEIFGSDLTLMHQETMKMSGIGAGPAALELGAVAWDIPATTRDQTALVCVTLRGPRAKVVSRSGYPIWISSKAEALIRDVAARRDYGPRLSEIKNAPTKLRLTAVSKSVSFAGKDYLPGGKQGSAKAVFDITNAGNRLAFHAGIEIANADCRYVCSDNYFVLMPGETKRVTFEIDRSTHPFYEYVKPDLIQPVGKHLRFTAKAWNAPEQSVSLPVAK